MPKRSRGWSVKIERSGQGWRCRWRGKYGTGQAPFLYKSDANKYKEAKKQDFRLMDAGMPPAPKIVTATTVGEWWAAYSKTKARENPQTFRRFDKPAVQPFVDKHSRVAVAAIDDGMIRAYKYALEDNYNGDTPQMYYRQLCAFFNAAVRAGIIHKSPATGIKKPQSGGGGGRPLTDTELMFLMPNAPEELYRAGVFSMHTRLRLGEVLLFDWMWFTDLSIPARNGLPKSLGWMGKIPFEMRKTRSKTKDEKKEDCVFAINSEARAVMGDWKPSGRVFPFPASTVQHQMTTLRRKLKLPEDITFHCFRHTGASRYLDSEGPDGGHMEDLLKTHVWDDARSLLRYVKPSPATLWRRAAAVPIPKFDRPAPIKDPLGDPKSETPRSTSPGG